MNALYGPPFNLVGRRMALAGALAILVVDDNPMVREATAWALAGAGHDVTEAKDGVAALEHLEQCEQCDLVISDVTMPRMSGLALSEAVRSRWPRLPVLLVSGRQQPPGTAPVMIKPFGQKELLTAVAQIVDAAGRGVDGSV